MPIKSDRWIRTMALEHGMIEPFVERSVREGVISYGLTSYGYDMRVTNQFKVFTNVFNALVDPKNFSPRSFVDIEADSIDIPPNSFALAQSYELFRIPRTVSAIVIGKSTYARCFRGDTRVALVDGTAPTLEAMARRAEAGERFWGYSINEHGRVIVTSLEAPRFIGRDSLVEIRLDHGQLICCTPDHRLLTREGHFQAAGDLRPGDALMPLYREPQGDDTLIYQPVDGSSVPARWLWEEWRLRSQLAQVHPASRPGRGGDLWNATVEARRTDEGTGDERATRPEGKWRNHQVAAIRELPGDHDVYCLTVPEAGNFALEAGVFVHNCGIIINVTPLEPEWEGYVTIEISNTTPLPARIYANEGIGQVLFLESDEACEVSYADKQGKYQGQHGIVLPRIERER